MIQVEKKKYKHFDSYFVLSAIVSLYCQNSTIQKEKQTKSPDHFILLFGFFLSISTS